MSLRVSNGIGLVVFACCACVPASVTPMRTMVLEEVAPDRWRAIPWPAIAVGVNTRLTLQFSAEEEGERDRFMFRHYWLETGPLSACP